MWVLLLTGRSAALRALLFLPATISSTTTHTQHTVHLLVTPRQLHGDIWPDERVARVEGGAEALLVSDVNKEGQQVFSKRRVARFRRRVDGVLHQKKNDKNASSANINTTEYNFWGKVL